MHKSLHRSLRRLRSNQSGLAMVEFAVSLPFFAGLAIGGAEIANYASVVMQLNQIALHTADNAARMGTKTTTGTIQISEKQINDVLNGTMQEGSRIAARENARVILSSFEEVVPFDVTTPRYRIRWQRCSGQVTSYRSNYGNPTTTTSVTGIGPAGRQVWPATGGSLMFVELQYRFKPMIVNGFTRLTDHKISQISSMVVRDARDTVSAPGGAGIYNLENVAVSSCT